MFILLFLIILVEWALRCWSFMGMIGQFSAGPIWACVKVDGHCDPSFAGTLTCVNSLKSVC
jgi:hypothetical protein